MKKLVSLAVASAFAAPVIADVNITGGMEYSLVERTLAAGGTTSVAEVDGNVNFTASTETANGIKVRAVIDLTSNGNRDGAGSHGLLLSGSFGSLVLGEGNGAVDNLDAADFTNVVGAGLGGRTDAAVVYTLPTMVKGLRVAAHYTPENGAGNELASVTGDLSGVSLRYSIPGGSIGYAFEDAGANSIDGYNITYGVAGLKFAYDALESNNGGVTTDNTQWSLAYELSDALSVGVGQSSSKANNAAAKTVDQVFYGAYFNLGGGVTAFAEYADDDGTAATDAKITAIGMAYSF